MWFLGLQSKEKPALFPLASRRRLIRCPTEVWLMSVRRLNAKIKQHVCQIHPSLVRAQNSFISGTLAGFPPMNYSLRAISQHFCWIKVRTVTWPFQTRTLCFFKRFLAELFMHFAPLSSCMTHFPFLDSVHRQKFWHFLLKCAGLTPDSTNHSELSWPFTVQF